MVLPLEALPLYIIYMLLVMTAYDGLAMLVECLDCMMSVWVFVQKNFLQCRTQAIPLLCMRIHAGHVRCVPKPSERN